jgi:hypothetical protein
VFSGVIRHTLRGAAEGFDLTTYPSTSTRNSGMPLSKKVCARKPIEAKLKGLFDLGL